MLHIYATVDFYLYCLEAGLDRLEYSLSVSHRHCGQYDDDFPLILLLSCIILQASLMGSRKEYIPTYLTCRICRLLIYVPSC